MEKYSTNNLLVIEKKDPEFIDRMVEDYRDIDHLIIETAYFEANGGDDMEAFILATKRANKEIALKARYGVPMFDNVPLEWFHASLDTSLLAK